MQVTYGGHMANINLRRSVNNFRVIQVSGNNPNPPSFSGSSDPAGTEVTLEEGNYNVDEQAPPNPPGLVLQPPNFSPGCSGTISAGQSVK